MPNKQCEEKEFSKKDSLKEAISLCNELGTKCKGVYDKFCAGHRTISKGFVTCRKFISKNDPTTLNNGCTYAKTGKNINAHHIVKISMKLGKSYKKKYVIE